MKVALFSTMDNGGAGKAALCLNSGLNAINNDSTLFVRRKTVNNSNVIEVNSTEITNNFFEPFFRKNLFGNIKPGNTICSVMYPNIGFEWLERLQPFDIVNLHWILTFISLEVILKIRQMGKPIVWTLHDQNPMTGACHYAHGCEKYKSNCSMCPQLEECQGDVTNTLLEAKIKYLPKEVVIVSPSNWLAKCARESAVFRNHRIEVIPNSIKTDIYIPYNKTDAKSKLGIPSNARVLLFGAASSKETRKGFSLLAEAVNYLGQQESIKPLIERNELYILTFGHSSELVNSINIPCKSLGYVNDEKMLAIAYSAADVLAFPSLEDNLPNILLESIACGTPVVAFEAGGMPDVIENGKNGYLVPLKNTKFFAERIVDIINENSTESMRDYCRQFAEQNYSLTIQAKRYQDLFREIIASSKIIIPMEVPEIFSEICNIMVQYCSIPDEIFSKKVIIFGTGSSCQVLFEFITDNDINNIAYLVDNNREKWNGKVNNFNIYNPDILLKENKNEVYIIIASQFYDEIKQQLEKFGFAGNTHFTNMHNYIMCYLSWKIYSEHSCNQ